MLSLLSEIAVQQGQPIRLSHLARLAGISVPTAKSVVAAMESLFLIRPYGSTWFFEDAGLSHHLRSVPVPPSRQDRIRLVYLELRSQISYRQKHQVAIAPYQTRGGIDIPFLVTFKSGKRAGLVVEEEDLPSNKALKSLTWAQKRFPGLEPLVLLNAQKPFETTSGIPCVPWTWVF